MKPYSVRASLLHVFAQASQLRIYRTSLAQRKRFSSASEAPPLVYPKSPTSRHHDLASFLDYADRSGLDPNSTTYVGTHYEYTAALALARYGFSLKRIGGQSDYGIDLIGTWSVPSSPQPLRVLLQCKAISRKVSPHIMRELEGAYVGAPVGWRGSDVFAFLVSENPITKGTMDALRRTRYPMGFIACSRTGQLHQIAWNNPATELGLQGLGVGMRLSTVHGSEPELRILWKGRHLPLKDPSAAQGEVE